MKVLTSLNEKGGVGKTTLSIHLAAGMAIRGYRVLLIDSDPQGQVAYSLGITKEPCFYNWLVRDMPLNDVLRIIPPEIYEPPNTPSKGLLAVMPGNVESRNIPGMIDDLFAIRNKLEVLQDHIDVVIFDTSPTPSLLHGSIYLATHGMLYPTELSALSFDSLMESLSHRTNFANTKKQMGYGDIQTLGIIPTKARLKTVEHDENLKMLEEQFGDKVWSPIGLSITWEESMMQRRPVFSYAPDSTASQQAWRVVDELTKSLKEIPV